MKSKRTWLVAVDGKTARFFEKAAPGARLEELEALAFNAPPPEPERDRAPRTHNRMGEIRHRIEARTTPRLAREHAFLKSVIAQLETKVADNAFDVLFLCAPPRAAGFIRANLPEQLRARVKDIWVKDLTRMPASEIESRLEGHRP